MKMKTPVNDMIFRIVSYIILAIFLIALLFPIYWMVLSSTKDEAAISAQEKLDFTFTLKDSYDLYVDTSSYSSYEYEDFKKDSTIIIFEVYSEFTNSNIGVLRVNWVKDGKIKSTTSLSEMEYRRNKSDVFPGAINVVMIETYIEDCYGLIEEYGSYVTDIDKTYNKGNSGEESLGIVGFVNSLKRTKRNGEETNAFSIDNILSSVYKGKYFKGLFENYKFAYSFFKKENVTFVTFFGNSLVISALAVIFQWVITSMASFACARIFRKKVADLISFFFIITMMIPSICYIVPLYRLVAKYDLINNPLSVVLPGVANGTAFILLKAAFQSVPKDLYEVSKIDGANEGQIFLLIYVPMSLSMFFVIALLVFVGNWNDLMWPTMVLKNTRYQTLPIIINRLLSTVSTGSGAGYPVTLSFAVLTMIPILLVFLLFQKQLTKGLAFDGIKG